MSKVNVCRQEIEGHNLLFSEAFPVSWHEAHVHHLGSMSKVKVCKQEIEGHDLLFSEAFPVSWHEAHVHKLDQCQRSRFVNIMTYFSVRRFL